MQHRNIFLGISGLSTEELSYLDYVSQTFSEEQAKKLALIYSGKRKSPRDIMLFTLVGFFGFAGLQRFVLNHIAMGVLFFITIGFFWIGTIIDLINHRKLTNTYNEARARESARMVLGNYY